MTDDDILSRLTSIVRIVLENGDLVLTQALAAKDVEGWDSFNHVCIMIETEKAFGVRFRAVEMEALRTVGDLVALIGRHVTRKVEPSASR